MRSHGSIHTFVQLISELTVGCNKTHVEYVPRALNLHINLAECEGAYSVPSGGQVKNE